MHDRRAPRGGARNEHAEYLDEVLCDRCGNTAITVSREFSVGTGVPEHDREEPASLMFLCDTCLSPQA